MPSRKFDNHTKEKIRKYIESLYALNRSHNISTIGGSLDITSSDLYKTDEKLAMAVLDYYENKGLFAEEKRGVYRVLKKIPSSNHKFVNAIYKKYMNEYKDGIDELMEMNDSFIIGEVTEKMADEGDRNILKSIQHIYSDKNIRELDKNFDIITSKDLEKDNGIISIGVNKKELENNKEIIITITNNNIERNYKKHGNTTRIKQFINHIRAFFA